MKKRDGFVLILVLWIVAILSFMVLSFEANLRWRVKILERDKYEQRETELARSGIQIALGVLSYNPHPSYTLPSDRWKNSPYYHIKNGKELIQVDVADVESKLNVNKMDYRRWWNILRENGVAEEDAQFLVNAIFDFIDKDNLKRSNGAEEEQYRALGHHCKNGPLEDVRELLLIKGITRELYKKIAPLFTTYGDGYINVNTASKEVLHFLFDGDDIPVNNILRARREKKGIKSMGDLRDIIGKGIYSEYRASLSLSSSYFIITSYGKIEGVPYSVISKMVVKRYLSRLKALYYNEEMAYGR